MMVVVTMRAVLTVDAGIRRNKFLSLEEKMAHLVACLGSEKGTWAGLGRIIASRLFDKVYLVTDDFGMDNYETPDISGVNIGLIHLDFNKSSEDLVPELYVILKKKFSDDKIQDLDIAVNIVSGTGKEHSVVISTLMKLGYGIRLVDLDKNGNVLEMI